MAHDVLDFLGPTRKALLLAIKAQGTATAAELAEETFLSIAATRAHLAAIERANLITHQRRRDGVGRPSHIYHLTEQGESLFPQGYADLASTLIALASNHPECGELLWESLRQDQLETLARRVTGTQPSQRIEQVARALSDQGYATKLRDLGDGGWEMTMQHCPILSVAREHRRLCDMEKALIADAVGEGATVGHLWRRPEGGAACVAVISWSGPTASSA